MKLLRAKLVMIGFEEFDYTHSWHYIKNNKNIIIDIFDDFNKVHIWYENCKYRNQYTEKQALEKILELLC